MQQKLYQLQKSDFLDNLQPDDFRNGTSFNQAHIIISELQNAVDAVLTKGGDSREFILKASLRLFREDSKAVSELVALFEVYLQENI